MAAPQALCTQAARSDAQMPAAVRETGVQVISCVSLCFFTFCCPTKPGRARSASTPDLRPHIRSAQRGGIYAQIVADSGRDRAEAVDRAKIYARLHRRAVYEERHIFARMVCGAQIGRVAAVIRGDDQQIVGLQHGQQPAQRYVKRGRRRRIAVDIPAVAVQHIKIDQIDKGQPVKIRFGQLQQTLLPLRVAPGGECLRDAAAGKDIVDLSHADHVFSRLGQQIQHRFARRQQRKIVAARRAPEGLAGCALKRARDYTAHTVLAHQHFAGHAAVFIQLLYGNDGFVRGDLKYGIGRGVNDERAGAQMLFSVILQYLGAGVGAIAQHTAAGAPFECADQGLGKAVRIGGQRRGAFKAGDLPVTDGGVFAHGALAQTPEGAQRRRAGGQRIGPL